MKNTKLLTLSLLTLSSIAASAGLLLSDAPILISSSDSTALDQASYLPQGDSGGGKISQDGSTIVFASIGWCGGDYDQIWMRKMNSLSSTPVLVSSTNGTCAGIFDAPAEAVSISADGRYAVFLSKSLNGGATNGHRQTFLKDLANPSAAPMLVSSPDGVTVSNAGNYLTLPSVAVTADGLHIYVLFHSEASNLIAGVSGSNLYIKDMKNPSLPPVLAVPGQLGLDTGILSGDGTKVIYYSGQGMSRYDLRTGTTALIDYSAKNAKPSRDGNIIVYYKGVPNLGNRCFVKNMSTGVISQIDVDALGVSGNNSCWHPDVSADGHYAVFNSVATNLVAGAGGKSQVFRKDISNLLTQPILVSTKNSALTVPAEVSIAQSNEGAGDSYFDYDGAAISGDGSIVTFMSFSSNLVHNSAGMNNFQLFAKGLQIDTSRPNKGKGKGRNK